MRKVTSRECKQKLTLFLDWGSDGHRGKENGRDERLDEHCEDLVVFSVITRVSKKVERRECDEEFI